MALTGAAVIPLGSPVARDLKRPTRGSAGRLISPYLALLRVGFAWPARRRTAGGLLPHRCTLADRRDRRPAVSFCGTLPGVAPAGNYPAPRPAEPGLSSTRTRRNRPACSRGHG